MAGKCTIRMSTLNPPLTTVFGVMFIIASIIATAGNAFVLFVLWRPGRKVTSSIKILSSLAVSDLLVGLVLSPATAWQVLDYTALRNCNADYVRRYFTVLLVGSSALTLALISYDRYILLTKLTNYNRYMTKRKIIIFLTFAWLFPALVPALQIKSAFGKHTYLSFVLICFFVPLVFLSVIYCYIVQAIKKKEMKLMNYTQEFSVSTSTDCGGEFKMKEVATKNQNRHDIKQIALAKAVAVLIVCYGVCITPISSWIIVNSFNVEYHFMNEKGHQTWYLVSMLMSQCNSCINPVIYFLKNPEFQKRVKTLFRRKEQSFSESTSSNWNVWWRISGMQDRINFVKKSRDVFRTQTNI